MFCKNCGADIPEGVAFCGTCGTPVENTPNQGGVAVSEAAVAENNSKNHKIIGIIAVAVAAIIVIALFVALFSGGSYEDVAEKFAVSAAKGDVGKAMKLYAYDIGEMLDDMVDKYAENLDVSTKEAYKMFGSRLDAEISSASDLFKAAGKQAKEEIEDEYGKKFKVTSKIVSTEKLDGSELKEMLDDVGTVGMLGIDVDEYFNPDKVKKGYEVELEVKIDGKDKSDTKTIKVTVVKYKGKWKVIDGDGFSPLSMF